ncbi:hypothetical protein OU994_07370 [Pseudoduganella sp. SL102]|uniref:hypothetical protein n=1 Tax=Pseudoduganella sp. SL102 TaxID=2995154 RepID=UPI00248C6C7E|nr:hypothetical protein [Pseudoduganella sp. SL102]WBS04096.1 hypothetical protein OU994_07370 [Pseudoduganella sp. SL102]
MTIFRAVPRAAYKAEKVHTRYPGARLPGNVPYFVDNMWEFTRPEDKPSRRHAVYASPTAALALDGAAGVGQPQDGFIACRVECRTSPKTFQLSVVDARYHPDVKRLQRVVHDRLGGHPHIGLESKLALAPLFLPGVTRDELRSAMEGNTELDGLVKELAALVTLWTDTPDTAVGELFFEIDEDNSYTLHQI